MMRASSIMLVVLALTGCATVPPRNPVVVCADSGVGDWVAFMNHVDGLDEASMMGEYNIILQQFLARSGDADRLRLSYLLSRPALPVRNMERSQILLAEVDPEGAYAPYRDLMLRELEQTDVLESERRSARELREQLEALKGIDTDLTRGQEEIEELTQ